MTDSGKRFTSMRNANTVLRNALRTGFYKQQTAISCRMRAFPYNQMCLRYTMPSRSGLSLIRILPLCRKPKAHCIKEFLSRLSTLLYILRQDRCCPIVLQRAFVPKGTRALKSRKYPQYINLSAKELRRVVYRRAALLGGSYDDFSRQLYFHI